MILSDDLNSLKETRNFYNKYQQLGNGQTPIHLRPLNSIPVILPPLNLNLYDKDISSMRLINTGETVMVALPINYPSDQIPSVSGSAFFTNYRFVQLHFHWGSNSIDGGSEHVIKSKRYAAELHLVHYNTKYNSLAEAVTKSDGLAVIGVLMDTTNNPNDNPGFEKIVSKLSAITVEGAETTLTSALKFQDLMPQNTNLFYRYKGSLTTPEYNEIVTWTVFKKPIFVSERQVSYFSVIFQLIVANRNYDSSTLQVAAMRSLHKASFSNYRELQSLNGRRVLYNWWPILPNFFY